MLFFVKKNIKCLFLLFLPFMASNSYGELYFGAQIYSADYKQDQVTIATLADDDPCCTGSSPSGTDYFIRQKGGGARPERIIDIDTELDTFKVKLGFQFTADFSIELRGGFGTQNYTLKDYAEEIEKGEFTDNSVWPPQKEIYVLTTPIDSELKTEYFYGLYLRMGGNSNNLISPYVILGHSRVNYAVNDTSGTAGGKVRGSSFGYGLNVRTPFERMYLNIEYLDLIDEDGIEADGYSAGFEYRF